MSKYILLRGKCPTCGVMNLQTSQRGKHFTGNTPHYFDCMKGCMGYEYLEENQNKRTITIPSDYIEAQEVKK